MSAGILIINDAGTILIDENYANLAVRTKLTQTTSAKINPVNPATPVVAFNDSTPASVFKTATAGFFVHKNSGSTLTAWIFDKPLASGADSGLQVFDAAGDCVFDSQLQYARVVDIFSGSASAQWSGTRTYPAGRVYAVAILKRMWRTDWEVRDDAGGGGFKNTRQRFVLAGATVSGNQIATAELAAAWSDWSLPVMNPVPPPSSSNPDTAATFAVIDVTGY